jgi:hypothetical protein
MPAATHVSDECDCPCHADPDPHADAHHAMPCCMPCSHCGKKIETALWSVHSDACAAAHASPGASPRLPPR